MRTLEFVIERRPVSVRTRKRVNYRAWKERVRDEADRVRPAEFFRMGTRLTIVFLLQEAEIDVDNVVKPIQDALVSVAYADDNVVADVACHRRMIREPVLLERLPPLLRRAWLRREECVYIRVEDARPLEDLL